MKLMHDDRPLTKAEIRRRKRLIHNIRAIILRILIVAIPIILILSLVTRITRHNKQKEEALLAVETEATETEIAEPEPVEIHLVMVGDVLLHTRVEESAHQEDGSYDYTAIFANVKEDIQAADLALVNQEVIIGGDDIGVYCYPNFNAPYSLADALVDAGFNVALHATNHSYDLGKQAILNCIENWRTKYPDMIFTGIHSSEEDRDANRVHYYEKDGIRVAILNYTYASNCTIPSADSWLLDVLDEESVKADITTAKANADFVIVCPHWGTEYQLTSSDEQEKWTQIFLEGGVDLVIGTHPHVIEPVEMLTDETTGHQMLVYYSLGNFVSWTDSTTGIIMNRSVGGMADVTIGLDENGKATITDYGVKALVCHEGSGTNGVTVYKYSDYSDELVSENQIRYQDSSFSMESIKALCDEVWGSRWE